MGRGRGGKRESFKKRTLTNSVSGQTSTNFFPPPSLSFPPPFAFALPFFFSPDFPATSSFSALREEKEVLNSSIHPTFSEPMDEN
jgi:hypothetical protein